MVPAIDLAFWNNGNIIVHRGVRKLFVSGLGTIHGPKPSPALDLYEYVEVNTVGNFEVETGRIATKAGLVITDTVSKTYIPIEQIRAKRIAQVKYYARLVLNSTEWHVIASVDPSRSVSRGIPAGVKKERLGILTAVENFEAAINAESNPALAIALMPVWL